MHIPIKISILALYWLYAIYINEKFINIILRHRSKINVASRASYVIEYTAKNELE